MYVFYNANLIHSFGILEQAEEMTHIVYFLGSIGFKQTDLTFQQQNQIVFSKSLQEDTIVLLNGNITEEKSLKLFPGDLIEIRRRKSLYILYTAEYIGTYTAILPESGLMIGRSSECDIVCDHSAVSRVHAQICVDGKNVEVTKRTENGFLFVNGKACQHKKLFPGDKIVIPGIEILWLGTYFLVYGTYTVSRKRKLYQIKGSPDLAKERLLYTSAPRILRSEDTSPITIDPPPQYNPPKPVPFLLRVGPSLTMAMATLFTAGVGIAHTVEEGFQIGAMTSSVMAVSMLAGALLWPWLVGRYNRQKEQAYTQLRETRYQKYLAEKEEEIRALYEKNLRIRDIHLLPDVEKLFLQWTSASLPLALFARTAADADLLNIRLGHGVSPALLDIQAPENHFTVEEDPLLLLGGAIEERYRYYDDAPIGLSLMENRFVGIFGTEKVTRTILLSVLASLCFLDSSTDVKIVLLFQDRFAAQAYECFLYVPHIWDTNKEARFLACDSDTARVLLTSLYQKICISHELDTTHYIVVSFGEEETVRSALYQAACREQEAYPVTFIFAATQYGSLPQECQAIVQGIPDNCGIYRKNTNNNRFIPFVPDMHDADTVYRGVESLAKIQLPENTHGALPNMVGFLDLFRVGKIADLRIAQRWKMSRPYHTLATPIGVLNNREILQFDLHEALHGAHGIVAGTTGSGKSELLQCYILSMMVNYSPDDVNFLLIDFKGGDIAIPFAHIPHVSAVVSNLTESMLYRAIVSLEAEKNRRQALFNETAHRLSRDKVDISVYQRLYRTGQVDVPVPHLIIIMDEFAQFKTQHGEYMKSLVDIAQIGRSLGIHLILATQKPAGVVDAQIWSNARSKICLKVLDREDSKALLQQDDAAYIRNPGRAYLAVGYNEIFSAFQSGYCGARYIARDEYREMEDLTVTMIDDGGNPLAKEVDMPVSEAQKEPETQIKAVCEEIRAVSREMGFRSHPLWMPPLPERVFVGDCAVHDMTYSVVIGLADRIRRQEQAWYCHNFIRDGGIALYGASGSGKTTLVQSILYQEICRGTSEEFQYAVLDLNGRSYTAFADTVYSLGVVSAGETDMLESFFTRLENEVARRRTIFEEVGCHSYSAYCGEKKLSRLLLVLENYPVFRETAYAFEERLIRLLNGGQSVGMHMIVTSASKSGIYYKIREQLPVAIAMRMADPDAYGDILGVPISVMPEPVSGRALILMDGEAVEMQAALPVTGDTEAERNAVIQRTLAEKRVNRSQLPPHSIAVPTAATAQSLPQSGRRDIVERYISPADGALCLGYDVSDGERVTVDIAEYRRIFAWAAGESPWKLLAETITAGIARENFFSLTGREADVTEVLRQMDAHRGDEDDPTRIPVLVIPDFAGLYTDISDADLEKLLAYLRIHATDTVYCTCCSIESYGAFHGTELRLFLGDKAELRLFCGTMRTGTCTTLLPPELLRRVPEELLYGTRDNHTTLAIFRDRMYRITQLREG